VAKLKSSPRTFHGRHRDLVDRYGISVTNDHGYVKRRAPLVEQELLTFPEQQ
jgi:hypothetical protein